MCPLACWRHLRLRDVLYWLLSATNGIFQIGGALGTLTLPFFADKWGRKWGSCDCLSLSFDCVCNSTDIALERLLGYYFCRGPWGKYTYRRVSRCSIRLGSLQVHDSRRGAYPVGLKDVTVSDFYTDNSHDERSRSPVPSR